MQKHSDIKTADEILTELGYKKNEYISEENEIIGYYNSSEKSYIIINLEATGGGLIECKIRRENVGFTIKEFKAVAKKLEEMGY